MGRQDNDVEVFGQASAQLEDEGRVRVAAPAWEGGGEDKDFGLFLQPCGTFFILAVDFLLNRHQACRLLKKWIVGQEGNGDWSVVIRHWSLVSGH
jgi:hypothetical protein